MKLYTSDTVDIKETFFISEERAYDHVPVVFYDILLHDTDTVIGSIDLRLKMNEYMYYYGHIGYHIYESRRGHHYALDACKIVSRIAREEHGMSEMIVTCNPENLASRKTIENLGGELIETIDVPMSHELYWKNEKRKCIFKVKL